MSSSSSKRHSTRRDREEGPTGINGISVLSSVGLLFTSVLLVRGGADGPAVVAADEEDGHLESRRKVHGGVEVALACRPVAKVGHGHLGAPLELHIIKQQQGYSIIMGTSSGGAEGTITKEGHKSSAVHPMRAL